MKYRVYNSLEVTTDTVDKWNCPWWVGTVEGEFMAGCRDLYDAKTIAQGMNIVEIIREIK